MKKRNSMKERIHIGRRQTGEGRHEQSVESARIANGGLRNGYVVISKDSPLFCPGILH